LGLFIDPIPAPRARFSVLAGLSLAVSMSGLLTFVGFLLGAVMAAVSLVRLRAGRRRGIHRGGRGAAIAALWISGCGSVLSVAVMLAILVSAYAALPTPFP